MNWQFWWFAAGFACAAIAAQLANRAGGRCGHAAGRWLVRKLPDTSAGGAESGVPGFPFDAKSLEFERGVEFGLMFARVKDYGRCEMAMHADMAELVMRLAEGRSLPFSGSPHEHGEHCLDYIGDMDCMDGDEWVDVAIG